MGWDVQSAQKVKVTLGWHQLRSNKEGGASCPFVAHLSSEEDEGHF